jgi:Uma2 family endonuclease
VPGKDPPAVKLTYQDYCRIPEDGKRHEILDGEQFVNPAPTPGHQGILGHLFVQLYEAVQERGLGLVYVSPIDVQLSEVDILQPDIVVILGQQRHIVTKSRVKGVPDLVVEVLSPSTEKHDRVRKMARFSAAGVLEYWIVNSDEQVVEQYLLEDGVYRLPGGGRKNSGRAVSPESAST